MIKKLVCALFGHRYVLLRTITRTVRELKCKRCHQEFGMHDGAQVVLLLDDELRKWHNDELIKKPIVETTG